MLNLTSVYNRTKKQRRKKPVKKPDFTDTDYHNLLIYVCLFASIYFGGHMIFWMIG